MSKFRRLPGGRRRRRNVGSPVHPNLCATNRNMNEPDKRNNGLAKLGFRVDHVLSSPSNASLPESLPQRDGGECKGGR